MRVSRCKRVYEPAARDDGYRVLVDRLWPRGVRKDDAKVDVWLKDIAPSDELRTWFNHESQKWEEFQGKYHAELSGNPAVDELSKIRKDHDVVTLLFAAKDEQYNNAVALNNYLRHARS